MFGGIYNGTFGDIYNVTFGGICNVTFGGICNVTFGGIYNVTFGGICNVTFGGICNVTFGDIYNVTFGGICNAVVSHSRILNSTNMKSGNTIAAQPSQLPLNPESPIPLDMLLFPNSFIDYTSHVSPFPVGAYCIRPF